MDAEENADGPVVMQVNNKRAADGIEKEPEVPHNQSVHSTPPVKTYRSHGNHLAEDRDWWLQGAYWDGAPRRDANLSDSTALLYWQRFRIFIKYVDEWFGVPDDGASHYHVNMEQYLELQYIAPFIDECATGTRA